MLKRRAQHKQQKPLLLDELQRSLSSEELLERAIRIDELHQLESVLNEPLESARLYDTEKFTEALGYLLDYQSLTKATLPAYALAPVVVSGLLSYTTVGGDGEHTTETTTTNAQVALSPDFLLRCQSRRRAAIYRLRQTARRREQLFWIGASGLVLVLSMTWYRCHAYWHSLVDSNSLLSCDDMPAYAPACRLAEATLWWKLQYKYSKRSIPQLHTKLKRELISWEEVSGMKTNKKDGKDMMNKSKKDQAYGSISYQLVNEILSVFPAHKQENHRVLDIGCGIGGLSHALSGISYHGISVSSFEVEVARQSLKEHAYVYQQDFDRPFPLANYTAAVAIDTLSFSRHLENTIAHILSSLVSTGGVLIIVDDVLAAGSPSDIDFEDGTSSEPTYRPSIVSHSQWMKTLADSGCNVSVARDLSLEYQVNMDRELGFFSYDWRVRTAAMFMRAATILEYLNLTDNPISQRLMELATELNQVRRYLMKRQAGFEEEDSQLEYHLYVCVKN